MAFQAFFFSFMSLYFLAFFRYDFIFLILILCLYGNLIFHRGFIGCTNELLGRVILGNAKVVFFFLAVAYSWDVSLVSLADGSLVLPSTAFFLGGFPLGFLKACLMIFATAVIVLTERFYLSTAVAMAPEFPIFFLMALYAIFGALQAADLVTMALFMELLSYCLFVMPLFFKVTNMAIEATLKYYILGSFSSGFLLMGVALVYAAFGTTFYSALSLLLVGEGSSLFSLVALDTFLYDGFMNIGFIFLFSAFFFKLGLVPFHYWVRDVYEGAPWPVVAIFSTVAKIPGALLLAKLVYLLVHSSCSFVYIFWVYLEMVGILSIIYGTFAAFYQTRLKSLLALSGIINMGYVVLALSMHGLLGSLVCLYYLVTYCFTTLTLIFVIVAATTQRGSLTRITDVAFILRNQGVLGWFFAIALLSAAGMPPLPGFFPKLLVL